MKIDDFQEESVAAAAQLVGLTSAAACERNEAAFDAAFDRLPPALADALGMAVAHLLEREGLGKTWAWAIARVPWSYKRVQLPAVDLSQSQGFKDLERAILTLRQTAPGLKLDFFRRSTVRFSRMARDGKISEVTAVERLYAAALEAGMTKAEATEVIKSAFYAAYTPRRNGRSAP